MGFYDEIAEEYDEMMDFDRRLDVATAAVHTLIERYEVKSACDVACGTGLYALALARNGLEKVTGSDLSENMLGVARRRAEQLELNVDWIQCDMTASGDCLDGPYDALLCLGNSIPHLLTKPELDATLKGFHQQLRPGGVCVLQVLNYGLLLDHRDRIVDITRSGDAQTEFVRFYDFVNPTIRFNLLTIHWDGRESSHHMQSTDLFPYRPNEIRDALRRNGFVEPQRYGGLDFSPFDPGTSSSLLLITCRE